MSRRVELDRARSIKSPTKVPTVGGTLQGVERRLSAILSADVVGYSRLIAEDGEETLRTLTAYREQLAVLVRQHHGRVDSALHAQGAAGHQLLIRTQQHDPWRILRTSRRGGRNDSQQGTRE